MLTESDADEFWKYNFALIEAGEEEQICKISKYQFYITD
jgi:hypothetical protein